MPSLKENLNKIFESSGYTKGYQNGIPELSSILKKLGSPISGELETYLTECIPNESVDVGPVMFYEVVELIEENSEYAPGAYIIEQGILCLAKDGGGNQFAFALDDGRLYHIYSEAEDTLELTKANSVQSWDSISDFLHWLDLELNKPAL